ncbi:MAG TPA: YlxR family protein [Candidatus Atribacteria bacterium]|mgnify:FL=1|nr:YlxR family protein [Candidatus Atribacteria bacterium]
MVAKRKIPIRTCVGCRERKEKKTLIRLVKKEEEIEIDPTGKKAGRGVYLCPRQECINKLNLKNLSQALRVEVKEEELKRLKEVLGNYVKSQGKEVNDAQNKSL